MLSPDLTATIFEGWAGYQQVVINALTPLTEAQLALRSSPALRSVDELARHMIAARAYWFYHLMGEGGQAFKDFARWDDTGQPARRAAELIDAMTQTWDVMQLTMAKWSATEWQQTWPGRGTAPRLITRQW